MDCAWIKTSTSNGFKSSFIEAERNKKYSIFCSIRARKLLCILNDYSLKNGITIINKLDDTRFEQFIRRIFSKIKLNDTEIFSEEELHKLVKIFTIEENNLLLAIKTLVYILKRLMKFIFMPTDLKNDLKLIELNNEKSEMIVKLWSSETRTTLDELGAESVGKANEPVDFKCTLNAELSSNYCMKTKVPKAYLTLSRSKEETEIEVTHPELYSMFLQFEAIQSELDSLGI